MPELVIFAVGMVVSGLVAMALYQVGQVEASRAEGEESSGGYDRGAARDGRPAIRVVDGGRRVG